jgi:glycosyltransferase involved in cell wall biosynthesis
MLSVKQVGRLAAGKRVAWRLADTWPLCGAEHYPHGESDRRFIDGYRRGNRLEGEWGLDLNRRVWERKRRHWKHPIYLVAPSRWMAEQASRSALAGGWPVTVIPTPLNLESWRRETRIDARARLGLSPETPILLFGALGGDKNPIKGADLLFAALHEVATNHGLSPRQAIEILTFGGRPGLRQIGPHTVRSVGHLDDDGLRGYYSAADVMVVPSRMDNLPQTAVEAIVCGTPVVAFRTGGLADIVDDGINGRLAEPFSPASLAKAIGWVLQSPERHRRLSDAARSTASRWDPARIAKLYVALFEEMLER